MSPRKARIEEQGASGRLGGVQVRGGTYHTAALHSSGECSEGSGVRLQQGSAWRTSMGNNWCERMLSLLHHTTDIDTTKH